MWTKNRPASTWSCAGPAGRSRQALWAALKPVRVVGIALADRARSAIRAVKQVTASTARGRGDRDVGGKSRAAARLLQERTPGT